MPQSATCTTGAISCPAAARCIPFCPEDAGPVPDGGHDAGRPIECQSNLACPAGWLCTGSPTTGSGICERVVPVPDGGIWCIGQLDCNDAIDAGPGGNPYNYMCRREDPMDYNGLCVYIGP